MATPLAGAEFMTNWNGLTLGDLFERIRTTMPLNYPGPGTLTKESTWPADDWRSTYFVPENLTSLKVNWGLHTGSAAVGAGTQAAKLKPAARRRREVDM